MAVVLIPRRWMIPKGFLPGAEALVTGAAGADAVTGSVGEQAERAGDLEVVGRDGAVAGVGAGCGTGSPQQPRTDAAFVAGDGCAGQVVAQRADGLRRLDPGGGRDVAVAHRSGRQVRRVDRRVVVGAL